MMHGFGFGGFGSFGLIGVILNLIITLCFILGMVLLGVLGGRRISPGGSVPGSTWQQSQAPSSPREVLQVRYARGEITREQYFQMLDDLS